MSRMRGISGRKADALNFRIHPLSTNQKPRFWALDQQEASISAAPNLTQVIKPLSFHSFQHHSGLFKSFLKRDLVLQIISMQSFMSFKTHSHHFPVILLYIRLILPRHPRTKRLFGETTYFIFSHSSHFGLIHIIPQSFISFKTHSHHFPVIHIIPQSFISFKTHSHHSLVIHII